MLAAQISAEPDHPDAERTDADAGAPTGPAEVGRLLQDCRGAVLAVNPAGRRLLGLAQGGSAEHDPSTLLFAVVDRDDQPIRLRDHPAAQVLRTAVPAHDFVVGVRRRSLSGEPEELWLHSSSEPVHDEHGTLVGALSTVSPVRGQRLHQLRRRQTERASQMLLQRADSVVALHLPDSTITWVSGSARTHLGYTPEQLLGVRAIELVEPGDRDSLVASFRHARIGTPVTEVVCARHADGRPVWVEITGQAMYDRALRQVQLQTVTREITERVLAEQARDQAVSLFHLTMAHAPIGLAVVDRNGHWVQVNRALCELTGYTEAELMARTFRDITHPDDLDESQSLFEEMLDEDGTPGPTETDKRYVRADGTVVWVHRHAVPVWGHDGEVSHLVVQVQDITARKQAQAELARQALSDPLTGLPNRLVLLDRLTHALALADRQGTSVGVLFLDLDGFKEVNDTYGHERGDEVLRQVAARLSGAVREGDTAVRLGGDEFVVVCEQVAEPEQVRALRKRIGTLFHEPFQVGSEQLSMHASIGMAVGSGGPAEVLLSQADAAMYRVKRQRAGGAAGGVRTDEVSETAAVDRLHLTAELESAVRGDQLRIDYQPIVRLDDEEVVAREALLRWEHPRRGLLLPEAFLSAAESRQRVPAVGRWVLQRACADALSWPEDVQLCVNVSANHLGRSGFADMVQAELTRSGLAPTRLRLEITEHTALSSSPSTRAAATRLSALGVRFTLDDFGTQHSSIAALHRLPISAVKIDRSVIAGLPHTGEARTLVDGLVGLGAGMALDVVAEGVETVEQAHWLREHGCPQAQGFLFGRPVAAPSRSAVG